MYFFQKQKNSNKLFNGAKIFFCVIAIFVSFGFANQALAGYSATTSFESSPINLTSSYQTNLFVLHTDIPTGTSLSI
ncbi:MAG: hypothetical protein ABH888_02250, partial [Patescibacteria group bacterium]